MLISCVEKVMKHMSIVKAQFIEQSIMDMTGK